MSMRVAVVATSLCLVSTLALAGQAAAPEPRLITLREAVDLALAHNHVVRLAAHEVDERQHAEKAARSAYFPVVRNESTVVHVTDTQLIEIPAGGLGAVGNNLIPPSTLILNQGGSTYAAIGTGLTQPLTQLLKIRAANGIARAETQVSQGRARGVENDIALLIHQLYYKIQINDARRGAVQAKIQASGALQSERVQQVRYGSALDADLIDSQAQSLQAKQELLSVELQLSDLRMQFNDAIGLPLKTEVRLESIVAEAVDSCARDECLKLALEAHPEIAAARATVAKAESAVRFAQYEFVPDVGAFVRYSYQHNVPFLARNFATFGVHLTYELFDGGRRRATVRERDAQLAQAREQLARVTDDVELRVHSAQNKLERTRQMVAVSKELVALRAESRRVATEQLTRGSALRSMAQASVAQELEANALLLQSRLDYVQAAAEMDQAIGRMPATVR